MSETPSLTEALESAISSRIEQVHISMPARIEMWNPSTQKASVQPLLKVRYADESGNPILETLPVIHDVPILFPGFGGYRLTFPVPVGSTVMLLFSESSLDLWLTRGGLVAPGDDRRNHLSDAVAIPGLYDFGHTPTSAPDDAMVLHAENLKLGGPSASDPVARRSDLDRLYSVISALTAAPIPVGAIFVAFKAALDTTTLVTPPAVTPPGWPLCLSSVKAT
jgi:Phage protein Gp138 N-terminal domain